MRLQHCRPMNSCIAAAGGGCSGGFKASLFPSSPLDGEAKRCLKGEIYLIKGLIFLSFFLCESSLLLAPKEGGEGDEQGLFCKEVVFFFYGGVGGSVIEEGASYCAIIGVDHGRGF